jgi:hypothetical protein
MTKRLWVVSLPRTDPYQAVGVYMKLAKETGIHGWYSVAHGWTVYRR